MAVSLTRFSWWLWGGKETESVPSGSSSNSSSDWGLGLREAEKVKFQSVSGTKAKAKAKAKIAPSNRKVKRKWKCREERRIDREYDVVLVPSDGDYSSGSESDGGLEWSIGWMEPHAPDFQSENEGEDSFAVLVPCYRGDCNEFGEEPNNHFFSAIKNLPNDYSAEGKKCMEQWLSSLQNF